MYELTNKLRTAHAPVDNAHEKTCLDLSRLPPPR